MSLPFYLNNELSEKHKLHVDSVSLRLILFLLKIKASRMSGVRKTGTVIDWTDILVLGTCENPRVKNHLELPYWKSLNDVSLESLDVEYISNFDIIFLAISSPKQDKLSVLLENIIESKEIHCLGAAVSTGKIFTLADRLGLNWIVFLYTNPRRFFNKAMITLKHMLLAYQRREQLIELFQEDN